MSTQILSFTMFLTTDFEKKNININTFHNIYSILLSNTMYHPMTYANFDIKTIDNTCLCSENIF